MSDSEAPVDATTIDQSTLAKVQLFLITHRQVIDALSEISRRDIEALIAGGIDQKTAAWIVSDPIWPALRAAAEFQRDNPVSTID